MCCDENQVRQFSDWPTLSLVRLTISPQLQPHSPVIINSRAAAQAQAISSCVPHYSSTDPELSLYTNLALQTSSLNTSPVMLRRAPTTLTITSEDVAAYEDRREREAMIAAQQEQRQLQQQQQQQQAEQAGQEGGHAMEGVQASPEATRRARDERIGVSRRR